MKARHNFVLRVLLFSLFLCPFAAHAQWVTQTIRLKPGWNAVYLHVDASHILLDDLIPNAADPVAEVWLWRPTASSMQFVTQPQQPTSQGSQWSTWTATRGDADTLAKLIGNAAYLVRNSSATDYVWTIKGKPIPPNYNWTSTGLNFIGFPTVPGAPQTFDKFFAPAPGLDLNKAAANGVEMIRYPGGDLAPNNVNPRTVSPLEARSVTVNRGEAYWVRANTNYFNRYYGPVLVDLQNPAGINFGENLGTYSLRLKNLTPTSRTVTLNQIPSETPPVGQAALAGTPQLLVRGARNSASLTYDHTVLNGNSFTLAPAGSVGSELEVVIGLNRTVMSAAPGSVYASVLRVTDTLAFEQIDVPVTATVPYLGGLWVGDANVNQVGQYLKSYPKITATSAAPRASYLNLDGATGSGALPAGVPFQTGNFTVEAWVNLRAAIDSIPMAAFQVVPAAATNGPSSLLSLNLTATGGRMTPNIAVPLLLDQAAFPEDGRSVTATTPISRDFGGTNAAGGQTIGFDLTLNGSGDNWGAIVLGMSDATKGSWVAATDPHLGFLFRVSGRMQAFDGAQNLTPSEPTWTSNNPNMQAHHIDVVCTDPADGNPFDGTGSTVVNVFVDGGAAPVFSYTKGNGGFAQNFINFQSLGLSSMRVRNLTIGGLAKPIISNASLPIGVWAHVAMVSQAGVGRIFLNGSKVAEGIVPAGFAGVITNGLVGANPTLGAPAAAGFDDFRIWSIARTETDIRSDMAVGRYPAGTSGLTAQYDFPPTGDAGADSSGNGRNLSLLGGAVRGATTLSADATAAANLAVSVAVANRPTPGSELAGATWLNRTPDFSRRYSAIASSQNGSRLLAAVLGAGGRLYISSDAGANWAVTGPDNISVWTAVASSGNGSTLAAVGSGDRIYVSTDAGTTWTARESARAWSGIAMSDDGSKMVATVLGGKIYTSSNSGATWTERDTLRNWTAVASSADGGELIAAVSPGNIFTSTNFGATWTARETSRNWSAVASSADGARLVAVVNTPSTGGQIFTSTDGGVNWTPRESNRAWTAVASSADGMRITALASGAGIFISTDGGTSWSQQEIGRNWRGIASSADGAKLSAVVDGGAIYTKSRSFASYTVDSETGLIRAQDGSYISTGVNTNLAKTSSSFPMRIILHGDAANNSVKLLQRVFVGKGAVSTNVIVATSEDLLDASQISDARRISAAHLPFSANNLWWSSPGSITPATALNFTVLLDYNDQASNPFLHTFHPDHDNLQSDFKRVEAIGVESFGVTRQIRLTFTPPGTDFNSLTASSLALGGVYEETMTITGRAGATRQFRLAGRFSLSRISSIPTLTTQ